MVHFVGAGPGAPDLITVRGRALIREADVIIYAGSLVNPALLAEAKDGCEIYNSARMTLEEVLSVMLDAQAAGKMTVRLHTGDPSLYGAVREQMDLLAQHGISCDVCPGVSSFCAAAASLQAEYTLPEVSQSVVITRLAGRTAVPEKESIESFAAHGATMVIFLSAGMMRELSERLMAGGYPADTPAAIVYKATWPQEKIVRCRLADLAEHAEAENITKTALIVVGNVLGDAYGKSRLYDASFSTEYRPAAKENTGMEDAEI